MAYLQDNANNQQLKAFIKQGLSELKNKRITEDVFSYGIYSLQKQFGEEKINNILLELVKEKFNLKPVYDMSKDTVIYKDHSDKEYFIYNKGEYKLGDYLLDYGIKDTELDRIRNAQKMEEINKIIQQEIEQQYQKIIDSPPQLEYKNISESLNEQQGSPIDDILEDIADTEDNNVVNVSENDSETPNNDVQQDLSKFVTHPQLENKANQLRGDFVRAVKALEDNIKPAFEELETKFNKLLDQKPVVIELKRHDALKNLESFLIMVLAAISLLLPFILISAILYFVIGWYAWLLIPIVVGIWVVREFTE